MKWSDVNPDWPDEPFKLYGPGDDSGTFDYFTEVINGKEDACRSDYSPSENDNALVTGVAGDKGALGYFGYAYYAENKDKLKLLAIDAGEGPVVARPRKSARRHVQAAFPSAVHLRAHHARWSDPASQSSSSSTWKCARAGRRAWAMLP